MEVEEAKQRRKGTPCRGDHVWEDQELSQIRAVWRTRRKLVMAGTKYGTKQAIGDVAQAVAEAQKCGSSLAPSVKEFGLCFKDNGEH